MRKNAGVPLIFLFVVLTLSAHAQEPSRPGIAAEFRGGTITIEELEKSAAGDLMNLAVQRQKILQNQLERRLASTLVSTEARSRGLSESELLQRDVYARATEPTVEEIDAYYQASKDMLKEPQERAVPRIRQALASQRRQKLYAEYVEQLEVKYDAKIFLGPFRAPVDAGDSPVRGPASAAVTIIEFSDFECPYCATLSKTLGEIVRQYSTDVRLVFRHLPLERIHRNAMQAAAASVCAMEQGRFWELHDELFKGGSLAEAELLRKASDAGLSISDFQACLPSRRATDRVRADVAAAAALGVSSTPSFFINGRPLRGAVPYAQIRQTIEEELARLKLKDSR